MDIVQAHCFWRGNWVVPRLVLHQTTKQLSVPHMCAYGLQRGGQKQPQKTVGSNWVVLVASFWPGTRQSVNCKLYLLRRTGTARNLAAHMQEQKDHGMRCHDLHDGLVVIEARAWRLSTLGFRAAGFRKTNRTPTV